ncbi:glycosyl hydrolase family protein [Artemisia annua]|uniref:Glycosyl hydrolase family protein n=1 Tax=Artemisia annua TaxID=35608 RepID=A0A2U1QEM6_ARTAN|nr:glycosyl hydrolase family protein [Artemisia annua]
MRLHIHILIACLIITLTTLKLTESTQPPYACDTTNPKTITYPFCKTTLPISARVKDLVSRLTLDEKILQLVNTAPGIPRLGIPKYEWWSEALHGVSNSGYGIFFNGSIKHATSFPQVILTAASFDARLWYRIGQAIGTEARAVYNQGQANGMTFWAPNINVFRDPRWGRGQETPGEDPLVSGKYAISYVRGVQGDTYLGGGLKDGHLQASACCKHFTAYDLDHWKDVARFGYDAKVTKQDLADTYQPPFQSCIQHAQASGIMCAYNRVNGVPNCADENLLTNIARKQWGFQGYITSDCDAVSIIYEVHKYAKTPEDAVAEVLKAGMDVNCGWYLKNYTKSAVQKKKLLEADVDRALSNLFTMRMRLGLFNGNPTSLPYGRIGPDQVCSKEHREIALEAARNGIVLLKNSAKILPLKKTISSLAVIGPNANSANTLVGNYAGPPCKSIEPLKALYSYVKNIQYHKGCNYVNCTSASIDEAVKVAQNADYVVLFMGLDQGEEREDFDRLNLVLPGQQQALITAVAKAAKKPVILVMICGGPVDISFAKRDPKIGGILWGGYPGEAGGIALAEIIFGDHNPGGKLPMTWYPKEFVKIPMTDMRMRPQPSTGYPGRTYRFYTGRKVYRFGYGLSYSKYSYEFVTVTQNKLHLSEISSTGVTLQNSDSVHYTSVMDIETESCKKAKFSATVGVQNHGEMDGKHAVLLFVKQNNVANGKPMKQLAAFDSVKTTAGERVEVEFVISPCEHFRTANEDGLMVIEEGSHYLAVGDQQYPISVLP